MSRRVGVLRKLAEDEEVQEQELAEIAAVAAEEEAAAAAAEKERNTAPWSDPNAGNWAFGATSVHLSGYNLCVHLLVPSLRHQGRV